MGSYNRITIFGSIGDLYDICDRLAEISGGDPTKIRMLLGVKPGQKMRVILSTAKISVEMKIPVKDSIILATTRAYDATLLTQDDHFIGLGRVEYLPRYQK